MPVEITMPLTKLEQAVADARKNEQIMAAKVEDAKATLKAAKGAWEESVGEVFRALDEMIADKRQPSLPFVSGKDDDEPTVTGSNNPFDPTPPAPASGGEPATIASVEIMSVLPTCPVVFDSAGNTIRNTLAPAASDSDVSNGTETIAGAKHWRDLHITEAMDGEPSLFDTFALFSVGTLGDLADALHAGKTFNLPSKEVEELRDVVEEVSAADATPIVFDRSQPIPVTVKEPEKPTPAKRGRKKKDKAGEATAGPAPATVVDPEPTGEQEVTVQVQTGLLGDL